MLDADYVDYELSPTRTTDSIHESGEPSGAGGGIDLLLANAKDRLPVLLEAKGATDRNLFLGIIQALTYAVEFSTPFQRERLQRAYPGRFEWQPGSAAVDLYLLVVGAPRSRHHSTFVGLVDDISRQLLLPGTAVAELVRRIVCIETDMAGSEAIPVRKVFHHPAEA